MAIIYDMLHWLFGSVHVGHQYDIIITNPLLKSVMGNKITVHLFGRCCVSSANNVKPSAANTQPVVSSGLCVSATAGGVMDTDGLDRTTEMRVIYCILRSCPSIDMFYC